MKTLAMAPYQDSTESYIQINRPFNKCQLKKIIYYESVFRRSDASHCRLSLCKIDLNREKIRLDIRIRDIFEKLFDDFKIIEEYSVGSGNTS